MEILNADVAKRLNERLARLRPDTRPLWGKMNSHQMVCHLKDSFGLGMGKKSASEEITFLSRTFIRWVALHTAMKWPPGVPTRPEMDQIGGGGTPPLEFAHDVSELASLIERFAEGPKSFQFGRHPTFGVLTEWEWMRWGYLHTDHHLRQFGL